MAVAELVPQPATRWCGWCRDAGHRTLAVAALEDGRAVRPLPGPGEPLCARHALAHQPGAAKLPAVGPVVLVGPPAIGKTTVATALAALIGQPFADVDDLVERRAGCSIPQIFAERGEPGFRELELQATQDALVGGGVVSLGGGAVTTPAVRDALRGLPVIWLTVRMDRVPSHVGTGGRPLLDGPDPQAAWRALAAEREPLYAAVSCLRITRTGLSPHGVAVQIAKVLDWPTRQEGALA